MQDRLLQIFFHILAIAQNHNIVFVCCKNVGCKMCAYRLKSEQWYKVRLGIEWINNVGLNAYIYYLLY